MKRLFVVMMAVLFLAGCGAAARESGFYEHNTMYQNWDHMKFSIAGYDKVSPNEAKKSTEQNWWGLTVK
jgi:thiamine biosynthesis lipoprotein ApbE